MIKNIDISKEKKKEILGYVIYIFSLLFLFTYVIGLGRCVSGSMEPYMYTNDYLIYNRLAYINDIPERGDVISFDKGNDIFCKRVVGIEGDKISFQNGALYINNIQVKEDYLLEKRPTVCEDEFVVPEGSVFVLGDNRMFSNDSRYWEYPFVDIDYINGKVFCVIPTHKLVE